MSLPIKQSYQEHFQSVAENAVDVICRFDNRLYHLYVNPAIEKVTGVPQAAFIGKRPHDLPLPPSTKRVWIKHLQFVFDTSQQTTFEFSFPAGSDGNRVFQSLLVPEFDKKGHVESVMSISRDITQIRDSEKQQSELVGIVSHELKNPVTSLKALTQIMQRQFVRVGDTNAVDKFKKINTQINKLTGLISDLLEATKIESKVLRLEREAFDFNSLVTEIVEDARASSPTHHIILKGRATRQAFGDKNRLGQVLMNLISNAIKYSPKGSKIYVSCKSNGHYVTCSVKDNGVGIPKDRQIHIFERFYRVSQKTEKIFPGLGLGLYIASELVKAHEGKIWVKSAEGRGSTFSFRIPLAHTKTSKNHTE